MEPTYAHEYHPISSLTKYCRTAGTWEQKLASGRPISVLSLRATRMRICGASCSIALLNDRQRHGIRLADSVVGTTFSSSRSLPPCDSTTSVAFNWLFLGFGAAAESGELISHRKQGS